MRRTTIAGVRLRADGTPPPMAGGAVDSPELADKLTQVEEDISRLRDERKTAAEKREDAKKAFAALDGYDTNSDEYKAAEEAVKSVGEIDDKIAEAQAAQVGILRMLGQSDPDIAKHARNGGGDTHREKGGEPAGWDSAGLFTREGIKTELERISTSKAAFGHVELGQAADRETLKADIGGTSQMRIGTFAGITPQIFRPLRILDLLPTGTTDGNNVPYTQEGGTFLAAEAAEGAAKAEGGVTFTDANAPVQTIAAWQKIRKQALADVAALQSIIDGRLRYSVRRRLEAQVLAGDGTDPNLRGILNTTGVGSVAFAAGTPLTELVLSGLTGVYLADAEASAVVVHPTNWQTMVVQKASGSGEYVGGGPFINMPQVLWGVPLIPSPAIPINTALVGDFSLGAQLFIREGVNVLLSDSDQDDFIRNRATILGEMRAALAVWRPAAFQKVALA
jgi:HK97 family phage major capsid protein